MYVPKGGYERGSLSCNMSIRNVAEKIPQISTIVLIDHETYFDHTNLLEDTTAVTSPVMIITVPQDWGANGTSKAARSGGHKVLPKTQVKHP